MNNTIAAIQDCLRANAQCFAKGTISAVESARVRGNLLVKGLEALALHYGIEFAPQPQGGIDSRGELSLNVKGDGRACGRYGDELAAIISKYRPRCGIFPMTKMEGTGGWCYMNHFDVEKMILEFKA